MLEIADCIAVFICEIGQFTTVRSAERSNAILVRFLRKYWLAFRHRMKMLVPWRRRRSLMLHFGFQLFFCARYKSPVFSRLKQ
jgi:hypothetical protein